MQAVIIEATFSPASYRPATARFVGQVANLPAAATERNHWTAVS